MPTLNLPVPCTKAASVSRASSTDDDKLRACRIRTSLCGLEAELIDVVFRKTSPSRFIDWVRTSIEGARAGKLGAVSRSLVTGLDTAVSPSSLSSPGPLLHSAAPHDVAPMMEMLIEAGIINRAVEDSNDYPTLHIAAEYGADDMVRDLIGAGAGAKVDAVDTWGRTPLHHAAEHGHRGVVVFLLLKGANASKATASHGYTPLHLAAKGNHAGVIEDLVTLGNACVKSCDSHGETALHLAARTCRIEACIALLRAGATIGAVNHLGLSCLDVAACNRNTGRLLQILTADESSSNRRWRCSVALFHAAKANKPLAILDLVRLGADPKLWRHGGRTLLHHTAAWGAIESTTALLACGALLEAGDNDGCTPLHRACMWSESCTVALLLRSGAKERATNYNNLTACELVGSSHTPMRETERKYKARQDNIIRRMLKMAPADRIWRRRAWLVLCRSRWLSIVNRNDASPSIPRGHAPRSPRARKRREKEVPPTRVRRSNGKKGINNIHGSQSLRPLGSAKRLNRPDENGPWVVSTEAMLGCGGESGSSVQAEGAGSSATAECPTLKLGEQSALADESADNGQYTWIRDEQVRFVSVVERLLMLREEGVFREVVSFL